MASVQDAQGSTTLKESEMEVTKSEKTTPATRIEGPQSEVVETKEVVIEKTEEKPKEVIIEDPTTETGQEESELVEDEKPNEENKTAETEA